MLCYPSESCSSSLPLCCPRFQGGLVASVWSAIGKLKKRASTVYAATSTVCGMPQIATNAGGSPLRLLTRAVFSRFPAGGVHRQELCMVRWICVCGCGSARAHRGPCACACLLRWVALTALPCLCPLQLQRETSFAVMKEEEERRYHEMMQNQLAMKPQ